MMKHLSTLGLALLLSACASSSIVPEGPNRYMIYREGGGAFSQTGTLKIEAIKEASAYCSQQGKQFQVTQTSETTAGAFKFPGAQVEFTCLKDGDSAPARTSASVDSKE
jgi:putative hemolysin